MISFSFVLGKCGRHPANPPLFFVVLMNDSNLTDELDFPSDLGFSSQAASEPAPSLFETLKANFVLIGVILATMWFIEILDTFVLGNRLQANGIQPRTLAGLDGILWSPFLHGGFAHLISNSVPFVILSALTLTGGVVRYLKASAIIIGLGGLMVWAFAIGSNENHIGASGWVFGLLGFLLAAAVFEKKLGTIAIGLLALFLYWSFVFGFVPRYGISWEGHLFGFIAGVVAAKLIASKH